MVGQNCGASREFIKNLSEQAGKFIDFSLLGVFVEKPAIFNVWIHAKLLRIGQSDILGLNK